ncbi:hypothetical protein GGS26DRAFT_17688 [Hypomontagnella submonticulosa]|nr:hypothetical protein GGS26DRAFT_17688 [Hypomontagnella submonticulosa]
MLRRIALIGRKAGEERQIEDMSPSPGDEASSPQDSKNTGGLASVFKGLAGVAGAAKLTKSPPAPVQSSGSPINAQIAERLNATPNILRGLPSQQTESFELLKNGSMNERVVAANALRRTVADYPLSPVLDIWQAAKDLVDPTNPRATRCSGWELLRECVKHTSSTDLERHEYFQTIAAEANPEDFHLRLAALVDLTNHARNLSGFEYDVFPLLSRWLEEAFDAVRAARSATKGRGSRKGKALATGEGRNFAELFGFINDVIKFNFNVADVDAAEVLIDKLLDICMNTSMQEDLQACIGVLDAIVTFGVIPGDKLKSCVHVLCSIHCLVPSLQKDAWHTISTLCRSHNGHTTVRLLLDVLASLPMNVDKTKEVVREVRGALSVLTKLVSKSSEKGYPAVPYALLVDGLSTVVKATTTWKINLDILRLTNSLFCDSQGNVNNMLADEDWGPVFDVAATCAGDIITLLGQTDSPIESLLAPDEGETADSLVARELMRLVRRLEQIILDESSSVPQKPDSASVDQVESSGPRPEAVLLEQPNTLIQKQDCIAFFTKIHRALPDSAAVLVLEYFKKFRCCSPSDPLWEENLSLVLDAFLADRKRSTDVRLRALQAFTEIYDMIELLNDQFEPDFVPELVRRLLADVAGETDVVLLQEVVSFTATVASTADFSLFSHIVDTLRGIIGYSRLRSPVSSSLSPSPEPLSTSQLLKPTVNQSPSNVVVRGYVQIFIRVLNHDAAKSTRLFRVLLSIAESSLSETDARITAMQLLFRLRADWANRIFVTAHTESGGLAASLYRTDESVARKTAEEASHSGKTSRAETAGSARSSRGISLGQGQMPDRGYPLRSASGSKVAPSIYQPVWVASDADVLPEVPSQAASTVLYCNFSGGATEEDGSARVTVLQTGLWLETVLNLLRQGCDWEVYSFILVHLPSQLSNHAVFQKAIPQLRELRQAICEQIKMNNFQEPPNVYGLRRADVAICLFHTLTMILSYHRYFQKAEEDEIVRTFVHGIATWERSAKCCIHALTICCHELPSSTSKALVTILQKMAQIITQPHVAMHILEFLACLSRLPSLYANFREDEYRIVFGISFRYLQYVRGRKQTYRVSSISDSSPAAAAGDIQFIPSTADDLPQYVYTLAYHVVVFWFLALKLSDRANHVSWIARNLFTDVDGSQVTDEQAHLTMDFMQRVAYADVDESAADPLFTADRFGEILKKRWLIGNSIVTIEQATATGWAQITKRQPSGTSSYTIRELFRPPPAHQRATNEIARDNHAAPANNILPHHLLVQLLSSMPQGSDLSRPISLPDDDAVNRAIRMFDHNSTVDGHKVGVIYIGENQTTESEILANVTGSGDYVEFLNGLGTLTKLNGATFNTQGLDRQYDSDGQYTFCWRDRVTEIVFHVTTQMPTNLENDPQCTLKKRHIGNDFVNIIFNDSGLPFKFDTFPSEFNFVNIVISPESRASFVATRQRTPKDVEESFYKVRVMSKPGFPEISPASETKIVSLRALPDFIRLLALNASVFSLVWAHREGGEHISAWRNRLREIKRLREKYGPKVAPQGPTPSPPGTAPGHGNTPAISTAAQLEAARSGNTVRDSFSSLRRSSVATFFSASSEQNSHRSSMLSTATTDNTEVMTVNGADSLVESFDFSKWSA